MRGPHFAVVGILFSLFGALGCAPGIGGRCVQDSDCQSGAHCQSPGPMGGVCVSDTTVVVRVDSGTPVDSGSDARDAATDLMSHDAAGDRSSADAVSSDGAGGHDAAPSIDAAGGHGGSSADAQADSATDH